MIIFPNIIFFCIAPKIDFENFKILSIQNFNIIDNLAREFKKFTDTYAEQGENLENWLTELEAKIETNRKTLFGTDQKTLNLSGSQIENLKSNR